MLPPEAERRRGGRAPGFSAALALCLLVVLAGCASDPSAGARQPAQPDAAPLPALEATRTRSGHEEIAAWYEREADSAEREAAAHARMGDEGAAAAEHCRILILGLQLRAEGYLALARLHHLLSDDAHE